MENFQTIWNASKMMPSSRNRVQIRQSVVSQISQHIHQYVRDFMKIVIWPLNGNVF